MINNIVVRNATEADIPTIVEFNKAMAYETEEVILDEDILHAGVSAVFKDSNKGFYIVAEKDGVVVGCLMITYEWSDWRNGIFWWIQSVFVKANNRSEGIYTTMYEYIKTLLLKNVDVAGIRLYVDIENVNAQEVYTKLGMRSSRYKIFEYIPTRT